MMKRDVGRIALDGMYGYPAFYRLADGFLLMALVDAFEMYDYVLSGHVCCITSRTILHGQILDEAARDRKRP